MKSFNEWVNEGKVFDSTTIKPILDILNDLAFRKNYVFGTRSMDALDISDNVEKMISKDKVQVKDDSHFNLVIDVLSDTKFKKIIKTLLKPEDVMNDKQSKEISTYVKSNFKL